MAAEPELAGLIPEGFERGTCRWGCGAPILWARVVDPITLKTKRNSDGTPKKVPLNRRRDPDGTWTPAGIGKVRWISRGELVLLAERLQGHHVTCPFATHSPKRRAR